MDTSLFHNKLLSLLNTFVPSKIKHTSNRKLWINHKIKQLRRRKQKAYNKARQMNLSLHWTQFKDLKRQMQRECRRSYNKYMSDIIHDSYVNSKKKKLFSFINPYGKTIVVYQLYKKMDFGMMTTKLKLVF